MCQYRRMRDETNSGASRLNSQLAQAARDLQDESDTQHTLDRSLAIATQLIPGCDFAGVSIVHRSRPIDTPALTDDIVRRVDQLQYGLQEGPCLDAIWTHETVRSPELAKEQRWPRWAPQVAEMGIASMLCLQLYTSQDTLGALNLLSKQVDAFDDEDVSTATHLAAHLSVALADSQHADSLHSASRIRTTIGQAEGILMERFSLTANHAFDVLSRVSKDRNAKLYQVADELVRTRETPGGESTRADLASPTDPWLL